MALLTISAAARAAGKDRGTIKRYIKQGMLSVTTDVAGNTRIDTSELMRVFGELAACGDAAMQQETPSYTTENTSLHQLTIETLREQLRAAQEREAWLKGQLEAEQQRSRELEQRMLPPAQERAEKKGFWAKFFS